MESRKHLVQHSIPVLTTVRSTHVDLTEQKQAEDKNWFQRQFAAPNCRCVSHRAVDFLPTPVMIDDPKSENPLETRGIIENKSGEGEIRTPGAFRHAGFQDRCNRPLCHLSEGR